MRAAELRAWLWPAAAAAIFASLYASGRTVFWGDLTYLHHPWRALAAEQVAAGRLPLYDPYAYLGMPLAGEMQGAAWYPGTLPFYLFPFEGALALYHAVHYGLAALFAYLWLRRGGLAAAGALGGAAAYAASGVLASRVPFLNHLSTLALLPALLLFADAPAALGLTCAAAFLSGYPLMLAGGALAAFALSWIACRRRPRLPAWAAAAALAAGIGAVLLGPALRLTAISHRGAGLPSQEVLTFGMTPKDLVGLVAPWAAPGGLDAARSWWTACWFGLAAGAAMLAALPRLRAGRRAALTAYVVFALLLCLGGASGPGRWLWGHLPGLHYVRYPGNMSYLLLPAAALLVGAGLSRRRFAGLWCALIAAELLGYALVSQPLARRGYFTDAGPLVRRLQAELGTGRYLLSPRALESHAGRGSSFDQAALDLKHRLYGITNAPYHLRAIGNFGEPLVPERSYEAMDFLYSRPGLAAAARALPWLGGAIALTPEKADGGPFRYDGTTLWAVYRAPGSSALAWWVPAPSAVPASLVEASRRPPGGIERAITEQWDGDDRLRLSAETPPGWVYLAEPALPGWRARLDGAVVHAEPALGDFQRFQVPGGRWTLSLRYQPSSFAWGLAVTIVFLSAFSAYWYNRLRLRH